MDLGSFLSLELATIGLVGTIVASFFGIKYALSSIKKAIEEIKGEQKSNVEVLQEIAQTLANANNEHKTMLERFASSARRAEKHTDILDKLSEQIEQRGTQMALLSKDHEKVMDTLKHSTERIVDKLKEVSK